MKLWSTKPSPTIRKTSLRDFITGARNSQPVGTVRDALTKAVRPGEMVWDVGAGDVTFSDLFCQLVGNEGSVFAFGSRPALCEMISGASAELRVVAGRASRWKDSTFRDCW